MNKGRKGKQESIRKGAKKKEKKCEWEQESEEKNLSSKTRNATCIQECRLRGQQNEHSQLMTRTQVPRAGFSGLREASIPTIVIKINEAVCKVIAISTRTHKGDNKHEASVCVVCYFLSLVLNTYIY